MSAPPLKMPDSDQEMEAEILPDFEAPPEVELDTIDLGLSEDTEIPELEMPEILVDESEIEAPSVESELEAKDTKEAEPHFQPFSKPALEEKSVKKAPAPLGFSFKNKVTATGLAVGKGVGEIIPGVPDDVQRRVDDRERKRDAEGSEEKSSKLSDFAKQGFKSWS